MTHTFGCRMFNQQELQILLGGVNSPIDLDDLRQHTQYGGLFDDHEPTIEMFWRVRKPFSLPTRLHTDVLCRLSIHSLRTSVERCCASRRAVAGRHSCGCLSVYPGSTVG